MRVLSTMSVVLALLGATVIQPLQAAEPLRYAVSQGGLQVEVTAPRADILRIRVGQGTLPEDASWAVAESVRHTLQPLQVTETATTTDIRTAALHLTLNRASLAMQVRDAHGHVVLADAAGGGLAFERGGFHLRKQMPEDAHYFGLGAREDGTAFGLFLDGTWRTNFDFGKAERDVLRITAEGGPVDYYVMAGPTPKDVVRQYAALTGTAPLTPLWALGFQQSHYSYMTQDEVQQVADHFRADHIPLDVLYCDIDYQDRNRPFTVNTQAFPDLPGMVARLKGQGMHLVLITDLHVANAPGQGYAPYDTGLAADAFVRRPDGAVYSADVWPGAAVFPDFSRPAARVWWGAQYQGFLGQGVEGFWNDMNEPSVFNVRSKTMPLDVVHRIEEPGFAPRNASHAEMHNVYGMLNSRATLEGLQRMAPDLRPFVLTCATYAGGQRYAATWSGDNLSRWDHLKLSVPMLVNLGLSGFGYAGDDIGGFAGDRPSADLLTRWIELGAFNPIFRDHYAKDKAAQEVWVHGAEHEAIRRRYIEARYRLMPYLYGLAEEHSRTGLPLMRPVFLEFPQVLKGGDGFSGSEDQFMLGADLLVAPAPTPESPSAYTVTLPGEGWYDYWTGLAVTGTTVQETPVIDRLPVFVRPGAIVPHQPLVQSTAERPQGALTVAVYPGADCQGSLYGDDGVSQAYLRGVLLRQQVTCRQDALGLHVSFGDRQGSWQPWWSGITLEVHGQAKPLQVRVAGRAVAAEQDAAHALIRVSLPDLAAATDVLLQAVQP